MKYIQCTKCLTFIKDDEIICPICENTKFVHYKNGKYLYNGQVYSKSKWYAHLASFNEVNGSIKLKHGLSDIGANYIKMYFKSNIKRFSFLGIILPAILFIGCSVIACIVGFILLKRNNMDNVSIYLFFLSIVYFLFAVVLLFEYSILGVRCYYRRNNLYQYQYTRISITSIKQKLHILDKQIIE